MASTAWKTRPASEKQMSWIGKLADEKQTGDLSETLLETLADVASGQEISGGQASDLLDVLFKAPRKSKPAGGFAPLVSTQAERKARYEKAKATYDRLQALEDAALAAAGGKAQTKGTCLGCKHGDHSTKEACGYGQWIHLGHDSDYYTECSCKEFIAATEIHEAALEAGRPLYDALSEKSAAMFAMEEFQRGDHVIVARGRKIKKGSKGQIAKISDGRYGMSAFLILEDGSKAWTALTNLDQAEG